MEFFCPVAYPITKYLGYNEEEYWDNDLKYYILPFIAWWYVIVSGQFWYLSWLIMVCIVA